MPEYVYSCGEHKTETRHPMDADPVMLCPECGGRMHRVPQPFGVVWGGNPPSVGMHPLVEEYNRTLPRRRDEFAAKKEAHVNRTEGESKATAES